MLTKKVQIVGLAQRIYTNFTTTVNFFKKIHEFLRIWNLVVTNSRYYESVGDEEGDTSRNLMSFKKR